MEREEGKVGAAKISYQNWNPKAYFLSKKVKTAIHLSLASDPTRPPPTYTSF